MNSSSPISFKGSTLTWGSVSRNFGAKIDVAILTPFGVLIQLSTRGTSIGPRNISLYDSSLQEIWQIQDIDLPNPDRYFMNLYLHEDGEVTCSNSDWGVIITDMTTGEIKRTELYR